MKESNGGMNINGIDIPKSTLAVACILWGILASLQTWHLVTTLNMKDKQLEQAGDLRVMAIQQQQVTSDVKSMKDQVADHEKRILYLESRK